MNRFMPVARINTLTDCIFAVAMMLMIFTFNFPAEDITFSAADIEKFLLNQAKPVFYFLCTFMFLGFYWLTNNRLTRYVRRADTVYLFLSLINIMFIVLVPYPNALIMRFPEAWQIQALYSLILALIGFSSVLIWRYCTSDRRLVDPDLDQKTVDELMIECLVEPTLALFSIGAAFISRNLWALTLLMVPIVLFSRELKNKQVKLFKRQERK